MATLRTIVERWRSEDGAQLVEFALVLPMLLLVVLGIAEFGFIFQRYEVVTNAAREGARLAVLPGYSNNAVITARVTAYVNAGRVPSEDGELEVDIRDVVVPVGGGLPDLTAKQVTVTYTHNYMFLPGIGAWFGSAYTSVPLRAVSVMRTETIAGS